MNERIQQLAEQAGFIDFIVFNRIESKEQVIEKFAQLIVQECADFIDSHKRVDEYGLACDIVYGVDLMKHFGVKE